MGKSISTPSIVVHICEEDQEDTAGPALIAKSKAGGRPKNTPRPDPYRQNSLE